MKKKALWLIVSIAFPLLALLFIFLGQNIEKYNNLEQMWARNEAFRAFYMLKGFWNEKKVDLKNTTQSAFDIVINPNQSQEDLLSKFGIDKDLLEKTLQKEPFALLNISKDNRKWAIFTVIGSLETPRYGGKIFFVDEVLAKRFSEFLQGSVQFVIFDSSLSLPSSILFFEDKEERYFIQKIGSFTDIYIPFAPSLYLKVTFDRGIFSFMKEDLYKSMFYFISILGTILILFYILLDRLVLSHIRHISHQIQTIKSSPNDLSLRITCKSKDELGKMVLWINEMLCEIETSQRKALGAKEVLLEEERNFLQTIIDSWQHALLVIDHEKILKVNDAFKKIFGDSAERVSAQQEALFMPLLHAQNHETIKIYLWERHFFFTINTKPLFQNKRLITLTDVSSFNEQLQMLQKKAMLDPLTSLLNRNGFFDRLQQPLSEEKAGCIIFSDIDNFKKINDTYGHDIGDKVLQKVSRLIQSMLRSSDVVARFGGEEFVIWVDADVQKTLHIAEKIRQGIAETSIESLHVTCSFGVSVVENCAFEEAIKRADEAMYIAKKSGKNRVCLSANRSE